MKINRLITILLCVCLLPLFASCGDSDDFAGNDNYITSFVLQKGGVGYAATIVGDNISVTVPTDIDLTGATPICELSEYATVSPSPETITDWNSAQQLVVTSKSSVVRTYKYTVTKSDLVEKGTVILRTQSDVNTFAAKKISELNGHLVIGENVSSIEGDSIKDLSVLSSLKKIHGNLIINNSFAGNSLAGLSNLVSVGNFYVGTESVASNRTDSLDVQLGALTSAGEIVINENKLKNLSFPMLNSLYSLYVNSTGVKSIGLDALKTIYADMTVKSNNNNTALASLNMNNVEAVNGSLTVQGMKGVAAINMVKLKTVGKDLSISSMPVLTTINMPIESIMGKFTMSSLSSYVAPSFSKLVSVGGLSYSGEYSKRIAVSFDFPALATINGDISIDYTALVALDFPALQSVTGTFSLRGSQLLETLSLPKLTVCSAVSWSDINKLTAIDLSKVSEMKSLSLVSPYILATAKLPKTIGDISINGGTYSTVFPVIKGLETVTGQFNVTMYTAVPTIEIGSVKSIATYREIGNDETSLSFPNLETAGSLTILLYKLTSLKAPKLVSVNSLDWERFVGNANVDLSSLTTITGKLKISSATNLTDIDFLASLKKVGAVNIEYCTSLTDFSGLKNALPSLSSSAWTVENCQYNPTYQNMIDGKMTL